MRYFVQATPIPVSSMTKRWIASSVALMAAACTSEPSSADFGAAFAKAGCGPTDGPAIELELSATQQGQPFDPPYIRLALYQSRAEAAGRSWPFEAPFLTGFAAYCATKAGCEGDTKGEVRFDANKALNTLGGEVDLSFPVRGRIRGRFLAEWRTGQPQCG